VVTVFSTATPFEIEGIHRPFFVTCRYLKGSLFRVRVQGNSKSEHTRTNLDSKQSFVEPLPKFDYTTVDPIKYRPFKKRGHDVAMGELQARELLKLL